VGRFQRPCHWPAISLLGTGADWAVVVIVALVAIGLDVRVDRIRDPLTGACEEDGRAGTGLGQPLGKS
jgi:hypothetical protein